MSLARIFAVLCGAGVVLATLPWVTSDFGLSLALSGDTIVVGASGDAHIGTNAGAAYVFTRSGNVWTQQQKLLASDGQADSIFGNSVDLDADTIATLALPGGKVEAGDVAATIYRAVGISPRKTYALGARPIPLVAEGSKPIATVLA